MKTSKRSKLTPFFILIYMLLVQSCQKDIIAVKPGANQNSLSIAEAKQYFDSHFQHDHKESIMSAGALNKDISIGDILKNKRAVWDKAYQQMISTGNAVKVPIDMGNTYAIVNKRTRAIVPFSSLNYLLMYKDSLQSVHSEWVMLMPDSAWLYGSRSKYTGLIIVKNWDGKTLKRYAYNNAGLINPVSAIRNSTKSQSVENGSLSEPIVYGPDCITFQVGSSCTCADKNNCDMCSVCAKTLCDWPDPECATCDPPGGGGGSGGGGGGSGGGGASGGSSGGGGGGGGNYFPTCNPDPNYTIPTATPPLGTQWILPCGGAGSVPIPVIPGSGSDVVYFPVARFLIDLLGINEIGKQEFLNNNLTLANAMAAYLAINGNTAENKDFVTWSLNYLVDNPLENTADFAKNFMTSDENSDGDTDDNGFYQNTVQQQQQLPSQSEFYKHYPVNLVGKSIYGLPASEVYTLIGGTLDIKNKNNDIRYQNACALRSSRALNYAGITIPVLVYDNKKRTEQGADGKNYIISATAFQRYMDETFGHAPHKLTYQQIGNDPAKIAAFLKDKTGIFVVTNLYPGTAGYSGHVDFIIKGTCINGSNLHPKGGIEKIEIWTLD